MLTSRSLLRQMAGDFSKRNHDLDLGVLRDQGKTPEEILGFLAYCIGLAEKKNLFLQHKLPIAFHGMYFALTEKTWLLSIFHMFCKMSYCE